MHPGSRPVRIITISREYGAGGAELAAALGEALGWRVIDRALIEEVARRIEAPEAEIVALDEHVGGMVERIAAVFARGTPEAAVRGELPDPDTVAQLAHAVLRDALAQLPFVVVGHGAQCVFARRPDALHVRVVAPRALRLRRVCQRRGLDDTAGARETERLDAERRRYIHHHFGCDVDDPGLYAIQLNTGCLTVPQAAALVLQMVAWRQAPTPDPMPLARTSIL